MEQLMQKLMVSKAIMDKTNNIARGATQGVSLPSTELQSFQPTDAKYNIPQEFLGEAPISRPTKNPSAPTVDAIKNSKLPDAIKKLMIEHPIVPPQMQTGPTLSNELVEKASRLMKDSKQNNITPTTTSQHFSKTKNFYNTCTQLHNSAQYYTILHSTLQYSYNTLQYVSKLLQKITTLYNT
jgi:hypothetical protein